jgi:hypothetical protein
MNDEDVFVVRRSEWGPDMLLNPHTNTKCCLGFAALQCGMSPLMIAGLTMPRSAIESLEHDQTTKEFNIFALRLEQAPWSKLAQDATAFLSVHSNPNMDRTIGNTVGTLLAAINDVYHTLTASAQEQVLPEVERLLRDGFEQAGYVLRFEP